MKDLKTSAAYSKSSVGDKVYIQRRAKAKVENIFDPTAFTVIKKTHGTFHLLSPLGNNVT